MKIERIRFKNLNSLVGEWEIDLSHPEFVSNGIFAIIGPTGSGKSTILDAICLALYGRTPRLDKVNKSGNEIISRQTGECFAEVTFETATGRYRCHWSQHRARRKPDGELQSPRHEIANAESGEVIESKIRGVADQIEGATGMDYQRFTRSILLAQGDFATFLLAAPDERAPILEQITGTEIYSLISTVVHNRERAESNQLKLLEAETAGIETLAPEKEEELAQALAAKQREEQSLTARHAEVAKAVAWHTTVAALKGEIGNLDKEATEVQAAVEKFKPQRAKLALAESAATLSGVYAALTITRKEQTKDKESLRNGTEALPGLESSLNKNSQALKTAEQQSHQAKDKLKEAAPILREVRSLDQNLAAQKKAVLDREVECERATAKIEKDKKTLAGEKKKLSQTQEDLELVNRYITAHEKDEWLVGNLTGVEEQHNSLLARQNEIAEKETECKKAAEAQGLAVEFLEKTRRQARQRKGELEQAAKQLLQGKDSLNRLLDGRLLREYRTEKESLLREKTLLAAIAKLEDHRAQLQEGKPCPLCGATEHPYKTGEVPLADAVDSRIDALTKLIDEAEALEVALRKLEQKEAFARKHLADAENQVSVAASARKSADDILETAKESLAKQSSLFNEGREALLAKLKPLGVADIPEGDISAVIESLKSRLREWRVQVAKKTNVENRIVAIESEIKRLDVMIADQNVALDEKRKGLEGLKRELTKGTERRIEIYGDKQPDDEEHRLHSAIAAAEEAERGLRRLHSEARQRYDKAKALVEELEQRIARREPELMGLEGDFSTRLAAAGFVDEARFVAAIVPDGPLSALRAAAKELDDRSTDLKARRQDREARLATELERKVTDEPLDELEPQLAAHEESLEEMREIISGFKHKLSENAAAKERLKEKRSVIESQKKECLRWANLNELIGSHDGKKYRNFAQGLTFEIMIEHANEKLASMSDRYLLYRDRNEPLVLNVIDNYQAGEIRSTKNLSGGESFLVSLALALGLSQMASKNVRVDSLFLDEGFGTLDEEALETALETLANLRQDGKLIGVISHVAALKERIGARIEVLPQANSGRSLLAGPGCNRL